MRQQKAWQKFLAAAISAPFFLTAVHGYAADNKVAVVNAGFEEQQGGQPVGWSSKGETAAVSLTTSAYAGKHSLRHSADKDYRVMTEQTLTNLPDGYYTLTARVRSSGGQKDCYLAASGFGRSEARTALPQGEAWTLITLRGIHVTSGQCTIGLYSDAQGGQWAELDGVQLVRDDRPYEFLKGGDISELTYIEDQGGTFRNEAGEPTDALQLLKERGWNWVRIRNYVHPGKGHGDGTYYCPDGYSDTADNLRLAKRSKDKGMQVQLSFHYSDYWTNGGVQYIPAAWKEKIQGLNTAQVVNVLEQCVYDYTKETLEAFKAQGTAPEYVSLGNEIQGGMLYPYGAASKDYWPNLARFFQAGARAVRDTCPEAKIILHLDDAGNDWKYDNFFDHCQQYKVDYDIIGASYYPFYLQKSVRDIEAFCKRQVARYHKPIVLMETGFAWNEHTRAGAVGQIKNNGPYGMTKEAQTGFMNELFNMMKSLPEGTGIGDLYWDPVFINHPGVGWAMREGDDQADANVIDNTTLFDFDGRVLPVLQAYQNNTEGEAKGLVSGTVRGVQGRPLAEAEVSLQLPQETVRTRTDRYGNFLFLGLPEGAGYPIRIKAAGYTDASTHTGSVVMGKQDRLQPVYLTGSAVRGTVFDDLGSPVPGAQVTAKVNGRIYRTMSAADGSYALADLPAADRYELQAARQGYMEAAVSLPALTTGAARAEKLTLVKHSGAISGQVVSTKGAPVADVTITATAPSGEKFIAVTDEGGRYTIPDVRADVSYKLVAARPEYISQELPQTVMVRNRQQAERNSFVLTKNVFSLTGRVLDEAGSPMADTRVEAVGGEGHKTYQTVTDAQGHYRFPLLLAGSYEVKAKHLGKTDSSLYDVCGVAGEVKDAGDLRFVTEIPLQNSGFETWGRDKYDVVGWQVSGTPNAVLVQGNNKHSGKMELAMWLDADYENRCEQVVPDLEAGTYSLSAWVMNIGSQEVMDFYIKDSKGKVHAIRVPEAKNDWTLIRQTVKLPAGATAVGFYTKAKAADWIIADDVQLVRIAEK